MQEILAKSTFRGFIGSIFTSILVLSFFVVLTSLLGGYIDVQKAEEYHRDLFWINTCRVGFWILILICIGLFLDFLGDFYDAKSIVVIDFKKGTITKTSYGIPFSKEISERRFDRIIKARTTQDSIIRLLGIDAGDVILELVIYNNAEATEISYCIRGIEDPEKVRQEILNSSENFGGLRMRIEEKPEKP